MAEQTEVVLCEDWCGLAVDHDGPCRSTPNPKEVSIEIVVSTLWREHAEEQDRRHRPITPESFVDYLVIQGWLDASLVYPEEG